MVGHIPGGGLLRRGAAGPAGGGGGPLSFARGRSFCGGGTTGTSSLDCASDSASRRERSASPLASALTYRRPDHVSVSLVHKFHHGGCQDQVVAMVMARVRDAGCHIVPQQAIDKRLRQPVIHEPHQLCDESGAAARSGAR